jgi:hypothetical protein
MQRCLVLAETTAALFLWIFGTTDSTPGPEAVLPVFGMLFGGNVYCFIKQLLMYSLMTD